MSFGVYFHIPYCIQRCTYCDFATYEQSTILPPKDYIQLVVEEMSQKLSQFKGQSIDTVYFGGGTPSLIPANLIVDLLNELAKQGLKINADAEVTIEINPATLDHKKMETYLKSGFNRFSVGAQTFNDSLLRSVHREHNASQTRETLDFLKSYGVNYSFDLLFAMPGQTLEILSSDLEEVLHYLPPHVSPYCLTVPEGHVLSKNRPLEEHQLAMFDLINSTLIKAGYSRYEISNYSLPGFESRHNSLYWDDSEYLSFGLSAHSYLHIGKWGTRFWNESQIGKYQSQIERNRNLRFDETLDSLEPSQFEKLEFHQSLTDFCHTFLRTSKGFTEGRLKQKFGPHALIVVKDALNELKDRGLVAVASDQWSLTDEGHILSNQVFSALTFLRGELPEP